ncbi:hypothetical protein M8J76_013417 [Diaphorina citri]|nr:hypothetical protein M8J76_013417 [Diaphorina citri]
MESNGTDEDFSKSFLGLDFSTQQLKAVIVDEKLRVRHSAAIQFDTVLPEFRTHNGVIRGPDKHTVTAPTLMWVKALDILLDQLRVEGADFGKLVALSGTGQQHGTVYWNRGARSVLRSLDPAHFLHSQLASCFSISHSPVWMDASTTQQCRQLEAAVGGPENLAKITGSVGYERFSGAQISKIAQTKPGAYENTERISLVSSFACSLFLGDYAPIDWSDGSGMNLLDISTKRWCPELLEACAPDLGSKLGDPVPCTTELGPVHEYYVERFGFNPECRVAVFTGDNPSSMAGMVLKQGDVAISLGTSDTLFLTSPALVNLPQGHILANPVISDEYMLLLCFKNGSLTRERIRDQCAGGQWDIFNKFLDSTPRGNFGNMGIFYDAQEILPWAPPGDYRYDKADQPIPKFTSLETEIRALVEGQFLAKRVFAERLGLRMCSGSRILATGGGASNKCLLQVLADIFNAPVYTLDGVDSANLGAAYRAKHCHDCLQSKLSQSSTTPYSSQSKDSQLTSPSEVNQQTNPFRDNQNTTLSGDFSNTNPFLDDLSSNQNTSPTKDLLSVQENQNSSPTKDSVDGQDNQSTTPSKDPLNGRENTSAESLDESSLQANSTDQQAKDTNQETDETSQNTSQPKDAISEVIGSNTELEIVDPKAGAKENEDGFGLPSFFESTACAPPAKLLCSPYPDAGKIYDPMVERFKTIIQKFEQNQENVIKNN